MRREIKIRIFAEYLGCTAIKGKSEEVVALNNIEDLVDKNFKLKLKSVYDLPQEELFEIAEEMRYNRCLQESFKDFYSEPFRVTSESRNKRNYHTAMVQYVAETDSGLQGNWFRLSNAFGVEELKAKGYDCSSCYSYEDRGKFRYRMSLEEIGLAVIVRD